MTDEERAALVRVALTSYVITRTADTGGCFRTVGDFCDDTDCYCTRQMMTEVNAILAAIEPAIRAGGRAALAEDKP